MKILCSTVLFIGCLPLNGQTDAAFGLQGILELVDRPPAATPVEALSFRLHPLGSGFDIEARPDRDGRFSIKARPGRYSLTFPMPGRIQTFAIGDERTGSRRIRPERGRSGTLLLVVSMRSVNVSVKVRAVPSGRSDVAALLAPADAHLTLRESCYLNHLSGPQTTFGFVPPGKYRIFIIDVEFQGDVAGYAARFPDFLKKEATSVEVLDSGQTEATATYLDGETIKEAIRQAGPLDTPGRGR